MDIKYWVSYGEWDVGDLSDVDWSSWKVGAELPEPLPTIDIDKRTIRSNRFDTLKEAEAYAVQLIQKSDMKWLAYVRIEKCITTTAKIYDIEKLKVLK
jgi:hypothetical protein